MEVSTDYVTAASVYNSHCEMTSMCQSKPISKPRIVDLQY